MKPITITLTPHQAEALFCILNLELDEYHVYNNNNGLTYSDDGDDEMDNDIEYMDKARVTAAKQLWDQLPQNVKERHKEAARPLYSGPRS